MNIEFKDHRYRDPLQAPTQGFNHRWAGDSLVTAGATPFIPSSFYNLASSSKVDISIVCRGFLCVLIECIGIELRPK